MSLSQISHYRVDRLIGVGGMGEVYLAEDTRLRRKVALKLLPERFTSDADRLRRFQREARAASALNHPNIITIYDIGDDDDRHYIATEYIEGETLRQRINAPEPMTVSEVLDISIGIASALATAHDAGILHRDIKPDNVMLRRDGYVKVLDFGLAKLTEGDTIQQSTTGAVMGTLMYLSPEQARGLSPDSRSDIYAIGAVMYEMITRQPPVVTESFVELAIAIATKDPKPPSSFVRGLPSDLDHIVMKALQKDREHRYQNARELLHDLRTLRQELEFETKLTAISGDGKISSPSLMQTAPLFNTHTTTSSVFARISQNIAPKQLTAIVLVLLCASILAFAVGRNSRFADRTIDSVAVLPFVNASGDPNSEYLSDGLAESIIDSLSQLPDLQVLARSTVFKFKGKQVDPLTVGRDLNVRGVVTGQLIHRGDTVIVRAALTDVKFGTQVWGQQYNRRLADVLDIQRELAERISGELRTKLSGEQKARLTRQTTNSEAYEAYLRGRYYLNKYTEESTEKAITFFNTAIDIDPTYALAYAGLANAYYGLSNVHQPPNQVMPRAREAAERAVQLDANLAEAHTALALVRTWYDWDFVAGEREFQRGLELSPNNAESHRLYGDFLLARGQFERALVEKKKAEQLDPLSVPACWDVGRALFYAGRLKEADEQARKALELDDRFANAWSLRAQIAFAGGHTEDAINAVRRAIDIAGPRPIYVALLGYLQARTGNKAAAEDAIRQMEASKSYTLPLFLARVNAGLERREEALRELNKLYNERSESVVWLKVDPSLVSLRNDPQFLALVKRVGI